MHTLNPQPQQFLADDPIKWDRRVPLGKMVVIPFMGKPKAFGPGSAITWEMVPEEEFFWPFDQEKLAIVDHDMVMPEGRTLIAFVRGAYEFVYSRQEVDLERLKCGTIVDQTGDAIDAEIRRQASNRE